MPATCRFTVFTATFNRAHTLHRVYDSLRAQTCRDFEWLIVDDGSTDDTSELVARWRAEAPFAVRYYRQANRGQHIACNRGLRLACGEFFAMIDSDDACAPHALARMAELWDDLPPQSRSRYFGVGGLCCDELGRIIGGRLGEPVIDTDPLDLAYRRRISGQKWWCARTCLLRRHPWLETTYKAPNPWLAMARRYRLRLVDEPLKIFYQDDPESSLSRAKGSLRPLPVLHRSRDLLLRYADLAAWHPREFVRAAAHYVRCSLHLGHALGVQWRDLRRPTARLFWLAGLPLGLLLWLRDRGRRIIL